MYPNNTNAAQGMQGNGNQWIPVGQGGTLSARNEVDRVLILNEVTGSLATANSELSELLADVRRYADEMLGLRPETGVGVQGGVPPKSSARVDGLRDCVVATHHFVNALRAEFERIRTL